MSGDWSIVIEGDPNVYTTAGVSSISSYSDATPAGSTVREGVLGSVDVTLSERLHPLDGTCEVSAPDFVLHDTGGYVTDNFTRALDRLTECDRIMLALRDAPGPLASHAECAAVDALSLARLGSTVTCSGAAARVATERKRVLRDLALRLEALTGDRRARC